MPNKIQYNDDPQSIEYLLKSKEMDMEKGILGNLFGSPTRAPITIAGILIFIRVIFGIFVSIYPNNFNANDYWTKILPIITLALGYIFGKKP